MLGPKEFSKKLTDTLSHYINAKTLKVGQFISTQQDAAHSECVDIQRFIINFILNIFDSIDKSDSLPLDNDLSCTPAMPLLHYACLKGWHNVVTFLLGHLQRKKVTIDLHKNDTQGKTAWEYALQGNNTLIINAMKKALNNTDTNDFSYEQITRVSHKIEDFPLPNLYAPLLEAIDQKNPHLITFLKLIEHFSQLENSEFPPLAPLRYLALQGGGVKGNAYVGTIKAMEETGTLKGISSVVGASAGAITAFLLCLGLGSVQITELKNSLDFRDLLDYDPDYGSRLLAPILGHSVGIRGGHSGDNIWHWAGALLERFTGKYDITFAEFKELGQTNPYFKEMIFKATNISDNKNYSDVQTFSALDTPNVRIVDALRASMSIPGVFKPHVVHEVVDPIKRTLKVFGYYVDGGVLCNFPVEAFNNNDHADRHYSLIPTPVAGSVTQETIQRNPCTVALTLCPGKRLDPTITPLSEEQQLRLSGAKNPFTKSDTTVSTSCESPTQDSSNDIAESETSENDVHNWKTWNLLHSGLRKFGLYYDKAENMLEKYYTYPDQVVQIYDEKVPLNKFDLSPQENIALEKSGYDSWMRWYAQKQDPSLFCTDEAVMTSFANDLVVSTPPPSKAELDLHFDSLFIDYFTVIVNEAKSRSHFEEDPANNQRIKFYSLQIIRGINAYLTYCDELNYKPSVQTILNNAFQSTLSKNHDAKIEQHYTAQRILDETESLKQLKKLLSSANKDGEYQAAIKLFQGKVVNIFNYIEESRGEVLALAIQTGDYNLVKTMLDMLDNIANMLKQTGRKQRYTVNTLLNEVSPSSFFRYALESNKDSRAKIINLLLDKGIDPLNVDVNNKNAFHYAIDAGDLETLTQLCQWYSKKHSNLNQMTFGIQQNTLGHYIVKHASEDTLRKFYSQEHNTLLKKLISPTKANFNGITALELAAKISSNDLLLSMKHLRNECVTLCPIDNINEHIAINSKKYKQKRRARINYLNKTDQIINTLSVDKIQQLSTNACLEILAHPYAGEINFIHYCASQNNTTLNKLLIALCDKILLRDVNNSAHCKVLNLMSLKDNRKSPLYKMAKSNNDQLVKYFVNYKVSVDNAGSIDMPSALTAAAKAQAFNVIKELVSLPWYLDKSSFKINIPDNTGKTTMHWLALSTDMQTSDALFSIFNMSSANLHYVSNPLDHDGNSAFYYLISNPQATQILQSLIQKGKGSILSWKLDSYFDFVSVRKNGYTDLEWAYKVNPTLAEFIAKNLKNSDLAKKAKSKISKLGSAVETALEPQLVPQKTKSLRFIKTAIENKTSEKENLYKNANSKQRLSW